MNKHYTGRTASQPEEDGAPTPAADARTSHEDIQNPAEAESGMEALLRDADYAFRRLQRGETVEGTVVRVDQDEVLVDIGLKSEGVIPMRELYSDGEEAEPLQIGDRTLVYVMQPESSEGHAILSLRRARMERAWREIEDLYHRGTIIEAPVVDFNKGGLIVDVKGVRGFVPVSQVLDLRNVSRQEGENEEISQTLAAMNGRHLPLKIIEINRGRNRLILSERSAVQERRTQRKDELMDQLEPGQVRHGVVSNITTFGAFIDLGGADGLVHVSELSYNRVNHPGEILHIGQEVDVAVLSVDRDTKKIALSLKRALPDPWTTVEERYRVGQVVPATITKLAKFGAFAKVEEGLEGLIHLSELTDLAVQDPSQLVREGQQVEVKIIHINSQRRRLGLSVRQAIEPNVDVQSFGDIDDVSPFASQQFTPYDQDDSEEYEASANSFPEDPLSLESEPVTGEQDSPAAEFEPDEVEEATPQSLAAADDEVPSTSLTAQLPDDEQETPVASAAPQKSTSE